MDYSYYLKWIFLLKTIWFCNLMKYHTDCTESLETLFRPDCIISQ